MSAALWAAHRLKTRTARFGFCEETELTRTCFVSGRGHVGINVLSTIRRAVNIIGICTRTRGFLGMMQLWGFDPHQNVWPFDERQKIPLLPSRERVRARGGDAGRVEVFEINE
jgi:hypothetical protein